MEKTGQAAGQQGRVAETSWIGNIPLLRYLLSRIISPCFYRNKHKEGLHPALFSGERNVSDAEILPLIEKTLDTANPRSGTTRSWITGDAQKNSRQSEQEKRPVSETDSFSWLQQTAQGMILKTLIKNPGISKKKLIEELNLDPKK